MRTTSAVARHRRVKKIRRTTKGMKKSRQRNLKMAKQAVIRSLQYAYRDRRTKKRDLRKLWIIRINAAARANGTTYRELINGLKKRQIIVNRKILSELAVNEPKSFADLVKAAMNEEKNSR